MNPETVNPRCPPLLGLVLGATAIAVVVVLGGIALTRKAAKAPARAGDRVEARGEEPDFGGGFPFGPGGPEFGDPGGPPGFGGRGGPGGPPGPMGGHREPIALRTEFDADHNGWLGAAERRAAREHLSAAGDRRGRGSSGRGGEDVEPEPGPRLSPTDVASSGDAPLYDPFMLRTLFLRFDGDDWEQELEAFRGTDVEVPASLEVDGRTLRHVGVRFRGNTSYMRVRSGRKRPFNLTLDLVHRRQQLDGYRTLNLLNAHEDPTLMRTVLFLEAARRYIPAPRANFVRLVINGESWGIYTNVQQFDTTFARDCFGTRKGARWKVPGSPGGRGGLAYLGDDVEPYRQIYALKSKENPKAWVSLILLCKTLSETPVDRLETALAPILDVDGVLRFLALDNALVNNDGFWARASDYCLYQDVHGRFHIVPHDVNESFAAGGSGPPGGRRPGRADPGPLLARPLVARADRNGDRKLDREEFTSLADLWFASAGVDRTAPISRRPFVAGLTAWIDRAADTGDRSRSGEGEPPAPRRRRRFSPLMFAGNDLFRAIDQDGDGALMHADLGKRLEVWFDGWDRDKSSALTEAALSRGLSGVLQRRRDRASDRAPGGVRGGDGARFGRRGPGGGAPRHGSVDLDPLILANDASRPLASRLFANPELRTRYLSYVRDIAENWLDWEKTGPLVHRYRALIEDDVKTDTRKLDSTQAFVDGIDGGGQASGADTVGRAGASGGARSLKSFFERRRAFLLQHPAVKSAPRL